MVLKDWRLLAESDLSSVTSTEPTQLLIDLDSFLLLIMSFDVEYAARMAVWYGTFRICLLRTSHLQPYRTSVAYFSSIFEAHRTRTIVRKTYRTSIPCFLSKSGAYRTVTYVPYQLLATLADFEITSL